MLQLTYIFHSGFILESSTCVLVFDYWLDPTNAMQHISKSNSKPVYVFASHFHMDHFTKAIFEWKKSNLSTHYTYILSKDILKHGKAISSDADVWLAKGGTWKNEHIKVTATGSNDSGVSWIVEVDDIRIFHAGDLCNWFARFLNDKNTNESIFCEELYRHINPIAEEKKFLGELKDIRKITDSFHIVMFPVDGRIGNGYTRGARQFIEQFKIELFVPMHFVASGFESAWRMEPFCKEKNIPFWRIKEEGESIVFTKCQI